MRLYLTAYFDDSYRRQVLEKDIRGLEKQLKSKYITEKDKQDSEKRSRKIEKSDIFLIKNRKYSYFDYTLIT